MSRHHATPRPVSAGRAPRRRGLAWAERSTLGVAMACLATWASVRIHGSLSGRAAIEEARALLKVAADEDQKGAEQHRLAGLAAGLPEPDTSDWDSRRVELWREACSRDLGSPIGILEYPSIGLAVAVLDGVGELELNRGVGLIPGTAPPGEGNCAVAGHRDGHFRRLERARVGDRLVLHGASGVGEYEVVSLDVVGPEDVSVLADAGRPELTLITCHPFRFLGSAPDRFVLRALPLGAKPRDLDGKSRDID